MNDLLLLQLKKNLGLSDREAQEILEDPNKRKEFLARMTGDQWGLLLQSINLSYEDQDDQNIRLNRALQIFSRESEELAEELRRREKEKFRLLFENMTAGFAMGEMVYDEQGNPVDFRFLELNPAFEKLTSFPREPLIGRRVKEFRPDYDPKLFPLFDGVVKTGVPINFEFADPKTGQFHDTRVFRVEEGKFAFVFTDFTDRRRAEAALRVSEDLFRTIYNGINDAILIIDAETGAILDVNDRMCEQWGASREETLRMLLETPNLANSGNPPYTGETMADYLRQAVEEGPQLFEWHSRRSDGTLYWNEMNIRPATINGQKRLLVVARDISERKKDEDARKKLEAQIQQVQKLESLGVLTGGIAHDFNNFLMTILANLDVAQLHLRNPQKIQSHLENAIKTATQASELCRQMLAYAGRGSFIFTPLNINELVMEMTSMLQVSISKKVKIFRSLKEPLPGVMGDPVQIRQILMNLVINASEATGDRIGEILIKTGVMHLDRAFFAQTILKEDLPEGSYIFLEVSDNGTGMDPETLDRIFDPFFTTKFAGRGLGLAATLGIVRAHKGAIKVTSSPGKGTTFLIVLPQRALPEIESQGIDGETTVKPSVKPIPGIGTLLLVEDDEALRALCREMLTFIGYQVMVAENGKVAIEKFRANAVHVGRPQEKIMGIILDLAMPVMDGWELFSALQEIDCEVPILVISGYNESEANNRFVGKKPAGFIQKPFQIEQLGAALNKVLSGGTPQNLS